MNRTFQTFVTAAAGAMIGSLGVAASGFTEIAGADEPVRMGHLVVERLDIVEPDGTLRQALYSKARDPQIVVRGQTFEHPFRTQSGMLFYNDEGSEVGGLVYAGSRSEDGTLSSGGSLTFDAYEQDQIVQILGVKEGGEQISGMYVSERPDNPMDFGMMGPVARETDRTKQQEMADKANFGGPTRAFFGRAGNEDATVSLRDGNGRVRLVMRVGKDGEAQINFLDEEGKIVRSLAASDPVG